MSRPKSSPLFPLNGVLLVVVFLCNLLQIISSTEDRHNGFSFKLIYRDSPESPLYDLNLTENDRIERLIRVPAETPFHSVSPKRNISLQVLEQPLAVIRPSVHRQDFAYMVQVGMGRFGGRTPYLKYYLVLDTGSDVTWTQCEGCRSCFHQNYPYFPRNRSRTYHPFPCNHCPPTSRCEQDHCTFTTSYGDGSSVNGMWASETFTFESNSRVKKIPNLIFGCGIDIHGFMPGQTPNNAISGVLGMSYGPMSFASQLKNHGLGQFSYCLHPFGTLSGAGPMFLRFGDDVVRVPGMVTTPLRSVGNRPYYYINLEGLSVANKRLNIPSSVFALKQDFSGGTIIDTGVSVSRLVPQAFDALLKTITAYIRFKNSHMIQIPPQMGFEACWQRFSDPPMVNLPRVTFHLENNADMVVQPGSVFYKSQLALGHDMYCLAMFKSPPLLNGMSQLGAYQQTNQRIIHDLHSDRLIFGAADCTHSN